MGRPGEGPVQAAVRAGGLAACVLAAKPPTRFVQLRVKHPFLDLQVGQGSRITVASKAWLNFLFVLLESPSSFPGQQAFNVGSGGPGAKRLLLWFRGSWDPYEEIRIFCCVGYLLSVLICGGFCGPSW